MCRFAKCTCGVFILFGVVLASVGENESRRSDDTPLFNPHAITTIRGKVVATEELSTKPSGAKEFHLRVRSGQQTFTVHLPISLSSAQAAQLHEGQTVEVTGSRVTIEGEPNIIAQTISFDGQVIHLRDETGKKIQANDDKEPKGVSQPQLP